MIFEAIIRLRPGARFSIIDDDFDQLIWYGPGEPPSMKEVQAEIARANAEAPMVELRARRDELLAGSDWTQMPDALSAEKRAEWAKYRQALRDMPANTADALQAVWPEPPKQ